MFTSNISTIHLVGYETGGARDGLVIGNFDWMACFILILLALMFAPFYINSGVATLPEFMERRYCPAARTFLAVIGILGALLIHIGISLFAAAKVFETLLGVPMFATIVVLSLFMVTYAALGGLKAVVMTESIQVVLLLGGATLVTILGVLALPRVGVHDLETLRQAVAPGQLHMLQPVIDGRGHLNEFSWLAVVLGYPVLSIWYWCTDQTHVQRPGPFDPRVPYPLATALSLSTTLSYLSFRAKRGICGAPQFLPDSKGQTYRQFQPSLFVLRRDCFYLRTHFVHPERRRGIRSSFPRPRR